MNKKSLSERDICSKFITPAVVNAGWDLQKQIREEVTFTDGRIFVRKKKVTRGKKNVRIIFFTINLIFLLQLLKQKIINIL
ncbi:hypothetical protein JQJ56_08645 [Bacillus paranthracis]|nr:hypothetical protein [Bacillus paranthracis]QRH07920.1 hypothetical protein JQJ56_08645 [Bacillus paranthracis]